ncbi:MAG: HAMP domain-containing sensor histidine kinase [Vicingaceae bacterium]
MIDRKVFLATVTYTLLWIIVTDFIVYGLFHNEVANIVETIKGLLFAISCSLYLSWYAQKELNHLQSYKGPVFNRTILLVASLYSVSWILTSDYIVFHFFGSEKQHLLQTLKGAFFILSYSLLVSWFSKREQRLSHHLISLLKSSQLGDYTAMIIHEISTPITVLKTYLSKTKQDPSEDNVKKLIQYGNQSIDSITQMTSFFRALAQQKPMAEIPRENVNLADLINDVNSFLKVGKNREVKIENEIDSSLKFNGARTLLIHVFMNLTKNALDYIAEKSIGNPFIKYESRQNEKQIEILISNAGEPLEKKKQMKIFTPFTSKKPEVGSGYGLLVCREIMRFHGGEIFYDDSFSHPAFKLVFKSQ